MKRSSHAFAQLFAQVDFSSPRILLDGAAINPVTCGGDADADGAGIVYVDVFSFLDLNSPEATRPWAVEDGYWKDLKATQTRARA